MSYTLKSKPKRFELSKAQLDELVKGHNSERDQVWWKTRKVSQVKIDGVWLTEYIGQCNYRNLYLILVSPDEFCTISWIRKQDIGDKYLIDNPANPVVRDGVLDKYRYGHERSRTRANHRIFN
jgi:hypothetical protein